MKYFLYRLDREGSAKIYGCFNSLSAAKMSAGLLLIKETSFILADDLSKIYFFDECEWSYDLLDDNGKAEFLGLYPDPREYQLN